MSNFAAMMARARNTVAEVEEAAVRDFHKVIARGDELHRKREKATAVHISRLDTMHAGLDDFEKVLDDYGNGAPPLEGGSEHSQASEPPQDGGVLTVTVGNDGKPNASR